MRTETGSSLDNDHNLTMTMTITMTIKFNRPTRPLKDSQNEMSG